MSRIWTVVWIIVAVFGAAGIVCAAVSLGMGGDINEMVQSDLASRAFDRLSPVYIIELLKSII